MEYCDGGDLMKKINMQRGVSFTEEQAGTRTHTHAHAHAHTRTRTHAHAHTQTHTHTHTHTHTQSNCPVCSSDRQLVHSDLFGPQTHSRQEDSPQRREDSGTVSHSDLSPTHWSEPSPVEVNVVLNIYKLKIKYSHSELQGLKLDIQKIKSS